MTNTFLGTALLIPVPEAEPAVGQWRLLFDPSASEGVPPHVTLIFPYLPSERCDDGVLAELRLIFQNTRSFDFELSEIGEFPGILFLSPRPEEPFIRLIETLAKRFPDAPPYGGVFPSIIPHVTIAHSCDATARAQMAESIQSSLPIHCRAREALLMRENIDGQWQPDERFPLAG